MRSVHPDLFVVHLPQLLELRPGSRVLDAGCGGGRNAAYLAHAGHSVLCLDLSQATLKKTGTTVATLFGALLQGMVEALPLAPDSFDVVICTSVLESLTAAGASAAAQEFRRTMRPSGHLLVVTAAAEGSDRSYSTVASGGPNPYQARLTTQRQLEEWFRDLRWLELLHLELKVPDSAPVRAQWALIARKP